MEAVAWKMSTPAYPMLCLAPSGENCDIPRTAILSKLNHIPILSEQTWRRPVRAFGVHVYGDADVDLGAGVPLPIGVGLQHRSCSMRLSFTVSLSSAANERRVVQSH
jgi:hypothetical protein